MKPLYYIACMCALVASIWMCVYAATNHLWWWLPFAVISALDDVWDIVVAHEIFTPKPKDGTFTMVLRGDSLTEALERALEDATKFSALLKEKRGDVATPPNKL